MLWLYLHFPQLQLDNGDFVLSEPTSVSAEQTMPVVVVAGQQNRVIQVNTCAYEQGCRLGMGLGAAAALSKELIVVPYDEAQTQSRLKEIADWLYLVSADIALFPPEGLALKVTPMLALYGDLAHYWQALQAHLSACKVTYHYACGYSPLAARVLARRKWDVISADADVIREQLAKQPLAALELPKVLHEPLARLGLHALQALIDVPLADLGRRFDPSLVQYIGRLLGHFQHPLTPYQPPETFSRTINLLFELENLDWLSKPLTKLLEQLEAFLRLRDMLAYEIKLSLSLRDSPNTDIHVSAAEGEYRADGWLKLATLTLSNVELAAPIQAVSINVIHMMPRFSEMQDLFSAKRSGLSGKALLSILQAKLGKEAIKGLCVSDDPRPEFSSQYTRPFESNPACLNTVNEAYPMLRPTLILPVAEPLAHNIAVLHGPERITTGWWDGKAVTRDYFIARDEQGRCLWVYRDAAQRWFVHGVFS